jgi:adenosine deaminase
LWRGPPATTGQPLRAPGERLGSPDPAPACRGFLDDNPKAALQWRQEAVFAEFEDRYRMPGQG